MHKRPSLYRLLILLIALLPLYNAQAATQWRTLKPGMEYSELKLEADTAWGTIHAFRIDPRRYHFSLAFAKDQAKQSSSVKQLAQLEDAMIAVNGGFFSPELQPMGLRIKNGIVRQRLKPISWWGVFYNKNGRYSIASQRSFRLQKSIPFAIQAGPRLIVNGKIPRLKGGVAERTAVGITRDHKIILLVTDDAQLTTTQLAKLMRKSNKNNGLNCYNALNLDGGHSTQLYAKVDKFTLDIIGFSSVTDALVVLSSV